MNTATRTAVYQRQNGCERLTRAQARRIRHKRPMDTAEAKAAHWTFRRGRADAKRAERKRLASVRALFSRKAAA